MPIDLDQLLNLANWTASPKIEGVDVIDKSLRQNNMNTPCKKEVTPRRKAVLPSKFKSFVVDRPSGYCPKCTLYVKDTDEGVVCPPCEAYWHYKCAEVTKEELDEEWSGIQFLCLKHRTEKKKEENMITTTPLKLSINLKEEMNFHKENIEITNIKINKYDLNKKKKAKEKLAKMGAKFEVTANDQNRQYTLTMSTPTYQLFIENIVEIGEQIGINVRRHDTDATGEMTQSQFTVDIQTTNGIDIPISLTCYHTANKLLIQLMGNKTQTKIKYLSYFIDSVLGNIIKQIENSDKHGIMKELLINHFQQKGLMIIRTEYPLPYRKGVN